MPPIRRLVILALAVVCAAPAATLTELRFGYTKPGHQGNYDVQVEGVDYSFYDAWDATTRFYVDLQNDWLPGRFGMSYGGGLSFEDRRRSPRVDGGGLPGYNNNRPTGFYGPIMKYQAYAAHAGGGPVMRLADWATLGLMLRMGAGAATLGIEYEGTASSDTALYVESSVDLNLVIAEGDDTPFIGLAIGGLSSFSRHKMPVQGSNRAHDIYNHDVSFGAFLGYRF
jgi:hypothetical protein